MYIEERITYPVCRDFICTCSKSAGVFMQGATNNAATSCGDVAFYWKLINLRKEFFALFRLLVLSLKFLRKITVLWKISRCFAEKYSNMANEKEFSRGEALIRYWRAQKYVLSKSIKRMIVSRGPVDFIHFI